MNETAPERRKRSREAFFGRHKGKPLSPLQASMFETLLPVLRVDLGQTAPADLRTLFAATVDAVRLEIGFGGGEHLRHETARFPGTGFIGVEPFVNGMGKMLAALGAEPPGNLRLYDDDATRLLDWLPQASLEGIDLLYPDPWEKRAHFKRRFVSDRNLDRFARVLKPGGRFRFASDIDTYVGWAIAHCTRHALFEGPEGAATDWRLPYEGWPGTRYEAKAFREGRVPTYLTFRRR